MQLCSQCLQLVRLPDLPSLPPVEPVTLLYLRPASVADQQPFSLASRDLLSQSLDRHFKSPHQSSQIPFQQMAIPGDSLPYNPGVLKPPCRSLKQTGLAWMPTSISQHSFKKLHSIPTSLMSHRFRHPAYRLTRHRIEGTKDSQYPNWDLASFLPSAILNVNSLWLTSDCSIIALKPTSWSLPLHWRYFPLLFSVSCR